MADGTVRGSFDLNTQPAIDGVRAYRQEAERADLVTKSLGRSIDDAFGQSERQRIEAVSRATQQVGTQSTETRTKWGSNWSSMRRDTEREATIMVAAIDKVHDRMQKLSRERATPTIDVDGIAKALGQVELLHQRLQALGRERATPRVAMGGGFSGAVRSAEGAVGGGGRGAFGFTGSGGSGIGFPLPSGTIMAGAALGLPAASALTGAATGVVGSAAGAALGAGATALGGLAPLVTGIAGTIAIAKPGIRAIQDVQKAQEKYTKVVREYGASSKQARAAAAALDRTYAQQPGLRHATHEIQAFKREWATLTGPARAQFFGGVADVTHILRQNAPNLARDATISTGAVRAAAVSQARFLGSSPAQDNLNFFSRSFARELPIVEHTLQNVETTVMNIARAAAPFFHEGDVWVERWTKGWASSTHDISATRREIEPMVQDFRDWARLTGAVFRTVRDIGEAAAPSGDSLVVQLTHTFDRWDAWIKSHPQETRDYFRQAAHDTSQLAGALSGVVRWLNQMSTLLRPILNDFTELVTAASRLGLAGTPGAFAALYGAYRGVRGGGAGGGGGGLGLMPFLGAGTAARAGGGVVVGETAGAAAAGRMSYLAPRAADIAAGPAGMLGLGGAYAASRLYRQRNVGIIGARELQARAGALATPETFAGRYGALEGARYAAPVSELGATAGVGARLGGAAGAAGGALRGAVRGYAPIAAAMFALDVAGGQGTLMDRVQSGLSNATFGAVPMSVTAAQAKDRGFAAAQSDIARMGTPTYSMGDLQARIMRLQSWRSRAAARTQVSPGHGIFGGRGFGGMFDPGRGGDAGPTTTEARENTSRVRAYSAAIRDLTQAEKDLQRQRRRAADDKARREGYTYGSTLGGAYDVYRHAGKSPVQAADLTVSQVKDKLKKIRPAGIEALGESSLAWARTMAQHNPALTGEVDKLNKAIEDRFRRMGRRVAIIHGDILTGTKTEWGQIRDAMTTPAEQAAERVSADFTLIQQKAVGSLTSMGFSKSQATKIVQALENGGGAGQAAQNIVSAGPNFVGPVKGEGKVYGTAKRARGGLIGGHGLMDTVPVPGGTAAPGEAWIANRHTLARLSRATLATEGLTAQQIISGETRVHSAPMQYARGGRTWAGLLPGITSAANMVLDRFPLSVTSTTGGKHANGSLHYLGEAIDLAGAPQTMFQASAWIGRNIGAMLAEGIHNPNLSIKNGRAVRTGTWGAATWREHLNHIHMGVAGAGGGARGGAAGFGGAALHPIHLRGVGMRQPGVPGLLRARAGDIYAKGLETKVNHALARMGGTNLAGFKGGGRPTANQALGRRMMLAAGWPAGEWPSLLSLWNQESGWNSRAVNPSSGAYGIPQSLGHGHPFALGDAPAQIRWGLDYIRSRYGSPSAAWGHERAYNWYARGGRMKFAGGLDRGGSFVTNGPTAFVAGEGPRHRREHVSVTPVKAGARGRGNVTIQHMHVAVSITAARLDGDERRRVGEEVAQEIIDALDRGLNAGVVE